MVKGVTDASQKEASWGEDQENVLRRLSRIGVMVQRGDVYLLGRRKVAKALVEALLEADLIRPLADGRLVLTAAGAAHVRRTSAMRKAAGRGRKRRRFIHGQSIGQAAFRAQHQLHDRATIEDHGSRTVDVNRAESPLGWLRQRRGANGKPYLSRVQFEAGERFRSDFELAGMAPRVTASWSGMPVEKRQTSYRDSDPTVVQIAARQRFINALDALGEELSEVVLRTCCFLEGLETVERQQGWPVRSGKVVLGLALERLARHYGLIRGQVRRNEGRIMAAK